MSLSRWSRVTLFLPTPAAGGYGCCSWQSADGTRHTLIIGIGLVSTKTASLPREAVEIKFWAIFCKHS